MKTSWFTVPMYIIFKHQIMNMKKFSCLKKAMIDFLCLKIRVRTYHTCGSKIISTFPYILNYIIFFNILLLNLYPSLISKNWAINSQINDIIIVSIQGVKILLVLCFIILQYQVFYILLKISDIFLLLTSIGGLFYFWLYITIYPIQVLASIVWVFNKQRRVNSINWDARWTVFPLWTKEFIVISMKLLHHWSKQSKTYSSIIIIVALLFFHVWTYKETIYNLQALHIIKCCERALILFYTLCFWVQQPYRLVKIVLWMCTIMGFLIKRIHTFKHNNQIIYIIEKKIFQNKSIKLTQEEFLCYSWSLSYLIKSQNHPEIKRTIQFHKKNCTTPECPIWYQMSQQHQMKQIQFQTLILRMYLQKFMMKYQSNRENLRDYIIFQFSPSSKALKYLQISNILHLRQIRRLTQSIDNQKFNQRDFQSSIQKANQFYHQINRLLFLLIQTRISFLNTIQNSVIDLDQLFKEALSMKILQNKIKEYSKVNTLLSSPSRFWVNMFFRVILKGDNNILQQIEDPPYFFDRASEPPPMILVAAQGDKYTSILKVTKRIQKILYYTEAQMLSLKVLDLIPSQMQQEHSKMLENKLSKIVNFQGVNLLNDTMYLTNKFGHIITGKTYIYRLQGFNERRWSIVFQETLTNESVIIIQDNGILLGTNENSTKFGFHPNMVGKNIKNIYLNHFARVCSIIELPYEQSLLADDSESRHTCDLNLYRVQQVVYFIKYYVIIINKRINSYNRRMGKQKTITQDCEKGSPTAFRKFFVQNPNYDFNLGSFQFQQKDNVGLITFQEPSQNSDSSHDIFSALGFKIPKSEIVDDEQPKQIDYKGDIITMVYRKGNFDYKQNYQIEEFQDDDFGTYPFKKQKIPANIDHRFYSDFLREKQNIIPKSLKIFYIVLIAITILNTLACSTTFIIEIVNANIIFNNLKRYDLVNYLFAHYIEISMFPLYQTYLPNHLANENIRNLLKQIIQIEKQFSTQQQSINKLFKSKVKYTDPQTMEESISQLQKVKGNYLIYVESYLKNSRQYQKLRQYTSRALYPVLHNVTTTSIVQYSEQLISYKILITSLVFLSPLFLSCSVIYYCIVSYKLFQQKKKNLAIFKDIDNSIIRNQLVKAFQFAKMIEKNTILAYEDQKINIDKFRTIKQTLQFMVKQATRSVNATNLFKWKLEPQKLSLKHKEQQIIRKKVIGMNITTKTVCFPLLWNITAIIITSFSLNTNNLFVKQFDGYFYYQHQLYNALDSSQIFVMTLANASRNQRQFYWNMAVQQFNQLEHTIYSSNLFSNSFMIFFNSFWSENTCQFLSKQMKECELNQRGLWQQGVSQIFSLIIRHGSIDLNSQITTNGLTNLQLMLRLQQSVYIPSIKLLREKFKKQFDNECKSVLVCYIVIFIIEEIIVVSWLICSIISLKKKYEEDELVEKLYLKLPFQQLIEIPSYQKYITRKMKLALD